MPWPSMAFARADATTATGYRLALPEGMLPNQDGIVLDPQAINRWDGFSPSGPILVRWPTGFGDVGLPSATAPDTSLAAGSPIVLIDMTTRQRVPFFAELDQNIAAPEQRTLIIRPMVRLRPGARYGVALRTSLVDAAGAPLVASEAFAAAKAGETIDHPRWSAATDGLPALLGALADQGIAQDDIALAWDFVTASQGWLTRDLLSMRDQALANVPAVALTVGPVTSPIAGAELLVGTISLPSFLSGDADLANTQLVRDADGRPLLQGTRQARIALLIPNCANATTPSPVLLLGHGIFGNGRQMIEQLELLDFVTEAPCPIVMALDHIGLTDRELALAPIAANDINRVHWLTDKLLQSVSDFLVLEALARTTLGSDAVFLRQGQSIIDPSRVDYIGGSLGGIMGPVIAAASPTLGRAVWAVPGANWSLLFERSSAWLILQGAAQASYPKAADAQLLIAVFGMAFEPVDPVTYAGHVIDAPLPGATPKRVLMWQAEGDSLVNNLATEYLARELGVPVLAPTIRDVWGLETSEGPLESAFVLYDEHVSPVPNGTNTPPATENSTHQNVSDHRAPAEQTLEFLYGTGEITATCRINNMPAACDCSLSACD